MSLPTQLRARATRKRLLDATVEALVECGYSGATTQEVCRRADVSRGTLLHHFGTRIELLVAALEYILVAHVETFVAARAAEGAADPGALLDLMWAEWQGAAATAWLELAVAARTNVRLREPMRVVMLEFDQLVFRAFAAVAGEDALPEAMRESAPLFVFSLLNGLAVGRSYEDEGHERPVLELMKQLATALLGGAR